MKEMELKYFVKGLEVEASKALVMLANRIAFVVNESREGQIVNIYMEPQLH